jgi:hypothetical protein
MKPTLGLVVIAKDSAPYMTRLLEQATLYADRICVFVDRESKDNTFEVCKPLCDRIEAIDTPGFVEPVLNYCYSIPDTTHILRLDSDELIGEKFVEMKNDILHLPYMAVWMPRYNVVGAEMNHYLSNFPLYPDFQLRLFRKGAIRHAPVIHTTAEVYGETTELPGVHIFHLNLVLKSKKEREKLVAHYDKIKPGAGSGVEYRAHYLPEDIKTKTVRPCEENLATCKNAVSAEKK